MPWTDQALKAASKVQVWRTADTAPLSSKTIVALASIMMCVCALAAPVQITNSATAGIHELILGTIWLRFIWRLDGDSILRQLHDPGQE